MKQIFEEAYMLAHMNKYSEYQNTVDINRNQEQREI